MKERVSQTILKRVHDRFACFQRSSRLSDPMPFESLKQDVLFMLEVGEMLKFCEKETILGLFPISDFADLPHAQGIEAVLVENMLQTVKDVYLRSAQRIKTQYGKGTLTEKEKQDIEGRYEGGNLIPGVAHHILGVFTSLLQMYFATHYTAIRLDPARLQTGSRNVTQELANIFKKLHPDVDNEDTFRKWAFISLFHDIAKIEENYSVSKHDVASARFLKEHGVLDMFSLPPEEKNEVEVIIAKHVEIGCHGPGDQSIVSLKQIFTARETVRLFTHEGGNVDPERLYRFLSNALLMWTHDSAGTTRKGLTTILPFDYLRRVFSAVLEIARPKNVEKQMPVIERELARTARRFLDDRIGRIVCAWLFSERAIDKECGDLFQEALGRLQDRGVGEDDIRVFKDSFALLSGKNHLFNMLVWPVRECLKTGGKDLPKAYDRVAKGFMLLTKAATELGLDDLRAVNKSGKMELSGEKREVMAKLLAEVLARACDVRKKRGDDSVVFINKSKRAVPSPVEMVRGIDKETKKGVLLVKIPVSS